MLVVVLVVVVVYGRAGAGVWCLGIVLSWLVKVVPWLGVGRGGDGVCDWLVRWS